MDIRIVGDKKSQPDPTAPPDRHAPHRDGQNDGDTIPARSAPKQNPSKK